MELIVNAKFEVVRTEENKEFYEFLQPIEVKITSDEHDTSDECYKDVHRQCMNICENFSDSVLPYQYSWCDEKFVNNDKEIR